MAQGKASATLGGKPLILTTPVSWTLREGIFPSMSKFTMAPADAIALGGKMAPVELLITPTEGAAVRVQNLWVLKILPGPNPYLSEVVVADRRWFWDRGHIKGDYNCRRNVGTKRLLENNAQLDVNFDRAFDIAYWRWSLLNQTTKYQALSMVTDVLHKLSQIEKNYWGQTFEAVLDERLGSKIRGLPIEDLQISDPGHEAVQRALVVLPEAGITVDYDGKVIVFSRAAGDEVQLVKAIMPEAWGKGHTDLVKNSAIRPREVHVLFTREVEVRFNFVETAAARTTGTQTAAPDEPLGIRRQMTNVISLPDFKTDGLSSRPNPINGRIMVQGTWVNVDDYLRSLPALPLVGVTAYLDHELLQRAFIPQMDLWGPLGLVGTLPDQEGDLAPWMQRVAELQLRYRRTFELNTQWVDKFMSFRAYRLSTINPQTGQRGPSMAYGDYCILPSQRGRWRSNAAGKPSFYAMNRSAYPTGALEYLDSTALPSPGVVSVVDMDQGIINVDYQIDLNRSYEMVLPSKMDESDAAMPTSDITKDNVPIAMNEVIEGTNTSPRLSPSFKLAVIVTAVPASPNSAQQYHRIAVKPADVAELLPEGAKQGLLEANGPIMEIYVGPGVEVARIAWDDRKADLIEKIFGVNTASGAQAPVPDDPQSQVNFSKQLEPICLNMGSTNGKAGASLNQIAQARAAAIYASFVDRYEGGMTGRMNGNVHLAGWTREITHQYTENAETYTTISFPGDIPQMSMFSFLSASERAVILKLAQP